jgi:hypothetical protein
LKGGGWGGGGVLTLEDKQCCEFGPNWIWIGRIQWIPWIKIRIRNPDPGGQKWSTRKEKI